MQPKPVNVLWIMADQWHADCLGQFREQVRTPNLDALAADGLTFTRAYCNNPICAPSRANFLTGQYQHTHGMQANAVAEHDQPAPANVATAMRLAGYRTGIVGKAHLPRLWVQQGFEHIRYCDMTDADPRDPLTNHYFAYLDKHGLSGWYEEGKAREGIDDHYGTQPSTLPYEHGLEHWTGQETLAFLRDGADRGDPRPFFLQMSFQRPHAPMRPAPEYFDLYDPDDIELPASAADWFERRFAGKPQWQIDRLTGGSHYPLAAADPHKLKVVLAAYYALITCIDMEIGRVIDQLRASGQYDNTLIVFHADHGDFAGDHGLFHKNFGIYESIHRIPWIMRVPGGPAGQRRSQMIESVDLAPTFCDYAGIDAPDGMDGRSLRPIIGDATAPGRDESLCEWSWINPVHRINALRTDRYRLVYYNHAIGGELYDHAEDPGELHNRWDDPAMADVRRELTERLFDRVNQYRATMEQTGDRARQQANRYLPSRVLHGGQGDWPTLRDALTTPQPARGPVPNGVGLGA